MVDGFVQALRAGADAIETGALDYPELVATIPRAVRAALDAGVLDASRLEDAARRTAELAAPPHPAESVPLDDRVTARCVEIRGTLPRLERPVVIECRTPGGMASEKLPWSLGEPLAELLPGTDVVRTTGPVDVPADRAVVLVVRDPQRVTWQQPLLDAAARHPRAVVVDCGWPADIDGVAVVRTRGVAPGLLRAAARTLAAGGSR
jgi:beta-N-acetylhexosaminidase